jgi:hypothetical protein
MIEWFDCFVEAIEGDLARVRTWSSEGEEATAWIETAKIPAEMQQPGASFRIEVRPGGWQIA